MRFPPELIHVLVPTGMTPSQSRDAEALAAWNAINSSFLRSYLWGNAIADAYLSGEIPLKIYHFSTGFVHIPEYLQRDLPAVKIESSFAFGGYVLVPGNSNDGARVQTIRIADHTFPIIIHSGNIELHSSLPNPSGGTSACWVKSTATSATWNDGILTCRHNVSSLGIGSPLSLVTTAKYTRPSRGIIVGMDQCTIDAAIVGIGSADFPSHVHKIQAINSQRGLSVEFNGCATGLHSGLVLRVNQMNNYFGNLFGHRVVIDCYGTYGDSGAFVKTTSLPDEGVGIYMGSIPDGSGGSEGLCQSLMQVRDFFKVDFYI